ncbi:MAG TPA: formylmethanofuran dehydrogenase subunit B [Conexibacter sp.]
MPSPEREITLATCAGCGCLCDDIEVELRDGRLERASNLCPLGDDWLAGRMDAAGPVARIDGREAELDDALDLAASMLDQARSPLVYGLAGTSVEAQREAVAVAEAIGAVIDPSGTARDGPLGAGSTTAGWSTATFGEVRDRAQIVVVWRADPAVSHPRLLERLRLDRAARAADRGRRTLAVVDASPSRTGDEADEVVALAPSLDLEALWAMRAMARDLPLEPQHTAHLPMRSLHDLIERLRDCDHAAVLFGAGLTAAAGGSANVHALNALVRDLGRETHVVALPLRSEGNALGAEDVLAWQTGYPAAVSFASGHPWSDPSVLSAATVLARGAADAALIVAADALRDLPPPAVHHLRRLPMIVIDARATDTADAARVAFRSAGAGIHVAGTAHRMDGVPVALRAPLRSARPGEEAILRAIRDRLSEGAPC